MIKQLLMDEFRFLTFRRMSPAIRDHWKAFLVFGLTFTWLAGVGRYWDNPRASLWQYLGLGSLAYVFVLALIIWALVAPLKPRNWSYRNVLLFITLTAPPAVLYAIPVERFMTSGDAVVANIAFLATVASWRVVLYALFLRRTAGLSLVSVIVCTLLPLVAGLRDAICNAASTGTPSCRTVLRTALAMSRSEPASVPASFTSAPSIRLIFSPRSSK